MKYRVYDVENNDYLANGQLLLAPNGEVYQNHKPITKQVVIQPFLNAYDRNKQPVYIGDALIVKQEWLPKGRKIWLNTLEKLTAAYEYDEILIQTDFCQFYEERTGDLVYEIFFKRDGQFLKNKDVGYTDDSADNLCTIPMDDVSLLQHLSKDGEIVYNITNKDCWVRHF